MNVCLAHGGDVSQPSGGTDRVTALAAGLQERGFEVTLVVPEPAEPFPDRLDGVDLVTISPGYTGFDNSLVRASQICATARDVARERDAMLQLEHSSLAGVGTLRGCRDFVLDMHDLAFARFDHLETAAAPVLKRGVGWLERRAVERAAHVIVVSPYLGDFVRRRWALAEENITVVPNGYFPDRIRDVKTTESEPGRVCFLGTLHPKVDVEVFGRIADLQQVSDLVVIGDGARRDDLDRLADGHPTVRVKGRLPDRDAFELLAGAQLLINPQTGSELQRSSSPVKLYYYAALGKPMVVSEGPSIVSDLVEAEAACAAGNAQEFVSVTRRLLDSESLRNELSMNARQLAKKFTWERRCDEAANLHTKLTTPQH